MAILKHISIMLLSIIIFSQAQAAEQSDKAQAQQPATNKTIQVPTGEVEDILFEFRPGVEWKVKEKNIEELAEKGESVVPMLIRCLRYKLPEELARRISESAEGKVMLTRADRSSLGVQECSAQTLIRIGKPAVPMLIESIYKQPETVGRVIGILGGIGDERAIPVSISVLSSNSYNWDEKATAAATLERMKAKEVIPYLIVALNGVDNDPYNNDKFLNYIADALAKLSGKSFGFTYVPEEDTRSKAGIIPAHYVFTGNYEQRQEAIRKWWLWWQENQQKAPTAKSSLISTVIKKLDNEYAGIAFYDNDSLTRDNNDTVSLRKVLFTDDPSLNNTLRVGENNSRLKTIRQLEANGSAQAIGILKDFLTTHGAERKLKQHTITALGRIGTPEAIDAIRQFESWSQNRFTQPGPFRLGKTEFAIDHFASYYLDPVAKTDDNGKTWAIFPWNRYGTQDIWLSFAEKDFWAEPVLLDLSGMPHLARVAAQAYDKKCLLRIQDDSVTILCDGNTVKSTIRGSLRDSDSDGLPDVVEMRLLTDSNNPDSDKDGIADGNDSNPLTPRHEDSNDAVEIRQAVFSILFATSSSRDAIVIVDTGDFAKQEYYGYAGVVLRSSQIRKGFTNITGLAIKLESPTNATATISDWEGTLAASVHEAKLKKFNGKWLVVEFMLTLIS
jgi:hypothetical protein